MIIRMLSYNTVPKRGGIHKFIYFAKSQPQNTCSNNKTLNYTKHKEIYILSHSTQTSHVTEWRIFIYTVLFSKSPKLRYFHKHMVTI